MHLLLVEDDHLVAQGLIRSLRQESYSVEHSGTVKHALECLSSGEIELVILDLGSVSYTHLTLPTNREV